VQKDPKGKVTEATITFRKPTFINFRGNKHKQKGGNILFLREFFFLLIHKKRKRKKEKERKRKKEKERERKRKKEKERERERERKNIHTNVELQMKNGQNSSTDIFRRLCDKASHHGCVDGVKIGRS
jgi:hypothetical protein